MRQSLKLVAIIISVFLAGYLFELAINGLGAPTFVENTVEIVSEIFSVLVAFSIFSLTWIAYSKSKDNHALYLGSTFFVVGVLILFHALSYPFMTPFITPNTVHKGDYFFSESRLILAVLFLASAIVYKDTLPKFITKVVLIASTIILSIVFLVFTLFYQNSVISRNLFFFPQDPENIYSPATVFTLIMITGMTLSGSYLYAKRARETGDNDLKYLVEGSIIIAISNLIYFSYEFSGHFLIIVGFYFFYFGLYRSSIELPYEKLAIAEEKLRHTAEEKYRNIFDNANDAIITIDLEDTITAWNKASEKLFGWRAEEVIGKKFSPLVVHESLGPEKEPLGSDASAGGKVVGTETIAMRRDGSNVDVSLTISPLLDVNGHVISFSGILRDITERKRAEERMRLHNQMIETIVEGINIVRASDGMIIYTNPRFEQMFGYARGELIGKHVSIVNAPTEKNHDEMAAQIKKTLNETGEWSGEVYNIRKDGTRFWCHANVSIFEHPEYGTVRISAHTDITKRKLAEMSISRMASILENTPDYVATADLNMNVLYINKGGRRMTGIGEKEDISKIRISDIHPEWAFAIVKNTGIPAAIRGGFWSGETMLISRDGREIPVLQVILAHKEDGQVVFLSTIMRDITEHKRAEEIQRENDRLTYASRTKSDFLATMSHELRTPLNAIIGFSDLLLGNIAGKLNAKQKHYVKNINTSSRHLLALISDILDLSKVESGKIELAIEKLAVPEVISEGLILIKDKALRQNIKLKTEIDPELGFIEADRLRFKQILFNLISNAVKFSKPEGGVVTVRTKKKGDMAIISVSDTGIGIKEEDLGKLFKEFEQVSSGISRKYGGTGLGLAISKKLVELHGGKIWAQSTYGEGSTFSFTLRLKSEKEVKSQEKI